jgi:hypothetical protein
MMTNTENKNTVASTILEQLGNSALAMLGANSIAYDANGVQFRVKGSRMASLLVITLATDDTYTVDAWKGRGVQLRKVATRDMVYADSLHRTIEALTGLYTRL